jgi:hypothetical protein
MFPVPWPVVALYLCAFAIAGMVIGAVVGYLAYRIIAVNQLRLLKDALLGAFGYLGGLIGCAFMPWPENTVIENLEGGGTVSTTMGRYQHPHGVAVILAILFPLIYQVYRWRKSKAAFVDVNGLRTDDLNE